MNRTTWEPVSTWYDKKLGTGGDWTHTNIVIPKTLELLSLTPQSTLLDLGCGQGILARSIPQSIPYTGIDIAPSLVAFAQKRDTNKKHRYFVGDITKDLPVSASFTHAACILTLDNIKNPGDAIHQIYTHLQIGGVFVFVVNHPCFRIPRQSGWGIDASNKIQYRKINRYLSPLEIPIAMHPSKSKTPVTWTYHYPISMYSRWLKESGFCINSIEEWTSDKKSVGMAAKMENRAREEFPLFLAVCSRKLK
jgi:ubiquinone/menaquinone biosynthesis C-methylase UbiE